MYREKPVGARESIVSEPSMRERMATAAATAWANFKHETPDLWLAVADAVLAEMERPSIEMRKVCSFETAEVEYPAMIRAARAGR